MACTMPRNALPNAMPAIVPALCIFSRAVRVGAAVAHRPLEVLEDRA